MECSSTPWLPAETSSVCLRLVTRAEAGRNSSKHRFGSRSTKCHCVSCLMSDCLLFSSHTAWQDQFLLCSSQQWADSITCILIIHYYTQVYYSPCSPGIFVSCASHKIELNMLLCTLLDCREISICSGPPDSKSRGFLPLAMHDVTVNSDRPHRPAEPPAQSSPAAALPVSSMET